MITRSPRRPCASYLAALPSTRAIPNRDVFYVARIPAAPFAVADKPRGEAQPRGKLGLPLFAITR